MGTCNGLLYENTCLLLFPFKFIHWQAAAGTSPSLRSFISCFMIGWLVVWLVEIEVSKVLLQIEYTTGPFTETHSPLKAAFEKSRETLEEVDETS